MRAATIAMNAALAIGTTLAITAVTSLISRWASEAQEARQEAMRTAESVREIGESLTDISNQYRELYQASGGVWDESTLNTVDVYKRQVEIFADADNIVRFRKQCAMHSKKVFDQLGQLLSANAADTAVSLDEILAALGKASEIDEEKLARGVLQFRRDEAAAEAPAESQPVSLTKAEAE